MQVHELELPTRVPPLTDNGVANADQPVPVDVLNLIHLKDHEAYKWYGVLTLPLLRAVGVEVGWMGAHVASFLGEPRAEEFLVVRYPSQRRFFALALNPYSSSQAVQSPLVPVV
jgi:hypothetical protein